MSLGYSEAPVIRSVDFSLKAGEVVGLLGLNGAGKTTLLSGLAGELRLRGRNPHPSEHSQECTALPASEGWIELRDRGAIGVHEPDC